MGLNHAVTNKEARPHFIKSYKGMRIPAFDELLYTEKDDFRVLRWVAPWTSSLPVIVVTPPEMLSSLSTRPLLG